MKIAMCQHVCLKICSILFLILSFSLAAKKPSFKIKTCLGLMNSTQCQCTSFSFSKYEIQCPPMVQNPQIKLLLDEKNVVTLTCNHFDAEEYQLPALDKLNISIVRTENCPLHILGNLGILGVRKLEYIDSQYRNLKTNLSGLIYLETLTLKITDLSLIREDLFTGLPKLVNLYFYSSNISLNRNIFSALQNLELLKLGFKNVQQLPVGLFRNQHMLYRLELHNTPLRNISKDFFQGAASIKNLGLVSTDIEIFPSDVFSLLKNLTFIEISQKNLPYLPSELFAHNKKLTGVTMAYSASIKALPSKLFANLPDLNSVIINGESEDFTSYTHNCLDEISHDKFTNSSKIRIIFLGKNKLETLNEDLFEHQIQLQTLDLSHNRLKSLPKELFRYTNQLTKLRLSHNYLTEISRDLFSNLTNLEMLYLNNNRIVTIDTDAFKFNHNLRYIFMENNHINMTDAFEDIRELRILNLSNNTLRNIVRGCGITAPIQLDLSHNLIASLNDSDLQCYSKEIIKINFNSNLITKVNITYAFFQQFSNASFDMTVQLNNNPIHCDCNVLPLLQYVRGELSKMAHARLNFIIGELSCDKPDNMKNLKLRGVEPKALLCSFDFNKFKPLCCPLGCECWERAYDSVLLVNCSSNKLIKVPALPRVQTLGLESIELYVENNELKELPVVGSTPGYENVTKVFATGNKLSHININNLPKNLIYLDISRNNFEQLDENMQNFFNQSSLLKIALSENPWNCECESKLLRQFVGQSSNMITDIDKLYCASPKYFNMTEYFTTYDICQDKQDKQISLLTRVVSISVPCFSIAIIAALYYKYQTEIKIWMYKYNLCSWWVNEEELDRDKTYDAFVSYSSKDEEFVGQLVHQLENGPMRFKLCVHGRDFIVGDIIPDQIIRAVVESRRTIVVLSKNFIKSVWARMEFRLAYQAGLDEKRTKVIVIAYGEIGDTSMLDLELQAYLKLTTYLEWGNPWFWERLRYIMPHSKRRNDADELELNVLPSVQNVIDELDET